MVDVVDSLVHGFTIMAWRAYIFPVKGLEDSVNNDPGAWARWAESIATQNYRKGLRLPAIQQGVWNVWFAWYTRHFDSDQKVVCNTSGTWEFWATCPS